MKDAKGHGSNPRGVTGAHATGVDQVGRNGLSPIVAPLSAPADVTHVYHGTTADFTSFRDPNESNDWEMMDRRLGVHFASDPEVSNAFTVKRDSWSGQTYSPEGARIVPLDIPAGEKFLDAEQPQYDWAKGKPRDRGNVLTDQTAIEKMIGKVAFQKDPEMLGRFISRSRNIDPAEGQRLAQAMTAGQKVSLPIDKGKFGLNEFIENFGAHPHDVADQKRMVDLARQHWQSQGYKGIRYTDRKSVV